MNKFQTLINELDGNQKSPVHFMPKTPLTSRFVSPWDTSGWYTVKNNLKPGISMYSNSDIKIKDIDSAYFGCDYIQTFNSKEQDLIDHPELDFFVETDCEVIVAMDDSCNPDWLKQWVDTDKTLMTSISTQYKLYAKEYKQSSHVHIPGFETDHNHYFVIIKPVNNQERIQSLCDIPKTINNLEPYLKRPYKSYINEVFNDKNDSVFTDEYIPYGCTRIVADEFNDKNRFLILETTDKSDIAYVTKQIGQTLIYPFVFKASVRVEKDSSFKIAFSDMTNSPGVVLNADGYVYTSDKRTKITPFAQNEDTAIQIKANPGCSTYEIWINHRKVKENIAYTEKNISSLIFHLLSKKGDKTAKIDNIELFDDTEIYAINEVFDGKKPNISKTSGNIEIKPYPFDKDKSLILTSKAKNAYAIYDFAPIDKIVSFETKVKVSNESFVLVPQLSDQNGTPALKIALYKNNLYASNKDEWIRVYEGLNPWMYYPHNNWFNIKVTADTDKGTYDLFVDGAKRACDFEFLNKVDNIAQAAYTCEENSTVYINRIRVYDCHDFSRGVIPAGKVFDIKKAPYNAKGDSKTYETDIIQKAINDAEYTGGTVYIHDGIFYCGEIEVKSDMTLFIDQSATILGTQDHDRYPLHSPGISLCAIRQLGRGLIYGENVSNVKITGGGMLDGNGTYRYKMNDPLHNRQADARPDIIYITYSNDIVIENLNMKNSPFWTVVPLSSYNITIRNLNLDCMNTPNRDGIDPVDCYNMTLYNCNIMAGDDGLCFKTSDNIGCYNIDAYDMMIQSLASGIKFGTDTYYSLKDAHIRDCAIKNVNRCGVSLETVDGAHVENVIFERLDMTDVGAPIYVVIGKRNRLPRGNQPVRKSSMKHVTFKDIRFEQPYPFSFERVLRESMVIGQGPDQLIEDIKFINFDLKLPGGVDKMPEPPVTIDDHYPEYDRHGLSSGHAFTIKYAKNVTFENLKVKLDKPDIRPDIAYFDYEE